MIISLFLHTEFASIIHDMVGGKSRIIHKDAMEDDPQRRKPDITRANHVLGWQPLVSVSRNVTVVEPWPPPSTMILPGFCASPEMHQRCKGIEGQI